MSERKPEILEMRKDMIQVAINNAVEIIELVGAIKAVEENKINLKLSAVNLKDAVFESIDILQEKFEKKAIKPEVNIGKNINVLVERTSFVNSVLNNIVTNAIKFSYPDSNITIEASQTGELVTIAIKDSGIGMPENLLIDVFDVSKSTSREGTAEEIGTGFGMPLIKKFMTMYGGKIELSSTEETEGSKDHGTQVKLILKASQ